MNCSLSSIANSEYDQNQALQVLEDMLNEYLKAECIKDKSFVEDNWCYSERIFDRSQRLKDFADTTTWQEAFSNVLSHIERPIERIIKIPNLTPSYSFSQETVSNGASKYFWYWEDVSVYRMLASHGASFELSDDVLRSPTAAFFHCAPDVYEFLCEIQAFTKSELDFETYPIRRNLLASWNEFAFNYVKAEMPEKIKQLSMNEVFLTDLVVPFVSDRKDASVDFVIPADVFQFVFDRQGIEPAMTVLRKARLSIQDLMDAISKLDSWFDAETLSSEEYQASKAELSERMEAKLNVPSKKGKWNDAKRKQFVEFVEAGLCEKVVDLCSTIKDGSMPEGKYATIAWLHLLANGDSEMFETLQGLGFNWQRAVATDRPACGKTAGGTAYDVWGLFTYKKSRESPYARNARTNEAGVREVLVRLFKTGYRVAMEDGFIRGCWGIELLDELWPDDKELHGLAWKAGMRSGS